MTTTKGKSSFVSQVSFPAEPAVVRRQAFAPIRDVDASRGFTLIELLIVVAIISILASIALPNFLEAQIRAKVARCQAELRTLTFGVEAYHLDNDSYPPHKDRPSDLCVITTPIAYLSALPRDVFASAQDGNLWNAGYWYKWEDLPDIYSARSNPTWGGGDWLERQIAAGRLWSLNSVGPDLKEDMATNAESQYDPSNGTISRGDVYRLGP